MDASRIPFSVYLSVSLMKTCLTFCFTSFGKMCDVDAILKCHTNDSKESWLLRAQRKSHVLGLSISEAREAILYLISSPNRLYSLVLNSSVSSLHLTSFEELFPFPTACLG